MLSLHGDGDGDGDGDAAESSDELDELPALPALPQKFAELAAAMPLPAAPTRVVESEVRARITHCSHAVDARLFVDLLCGTSSFWRRGRERVSMVF